MRSEAHQRWLIRNEIIILWKFCLVNNVHQAVCKLFVMQIRINLSLLNSTANIQNGAPWVPPFSRGFLLAACRLGNSELAKEFATLSLDCVTDGLVEYSF